MIRNRIYLVFLIFLPIFICSSSIIDNNLKIENFNGQESKIKSPVKRYLLKRVQIPFKWGKRSLFKNSDPKEFCIDFFAVFLTQNKQELKILRELDHNKIYDYCSDHILRLVASESDSNNKQFDEYSSGEISIMGNSKAELLKRSNIPFRWG